MMDCFVILCVLVCGVSNCRLLLYLLPSYESPGKRSWGSLKVLEKSSNFFISKRVGTLIVEATHG